MKKSLKSSLYIVLLSVVTFEHDSLSPNTNQKLKTINRMSGLGGIKGSTEEFFEVATLASQISQLQKEVELLKDRFEKIPQPNSSVYYKRLQEGVKKSSLLIAHAALQLAAQCHVCDSGDTKLNSVRVHVPADPPRIVNTENTIGGKHRVWSFLAKAPIVNFSCWVLSFLLGHLIWFDIVDLWWPWACLALTPSVIPILVVVAICHRKTTRILCGSFQTIFVWFHSAVLCIALTVLWRQHPSKLAVLGIVGPVALGSSAIMDATPEKVRRVASLVFFFCNVFVVGTLFLMVNFEAAEFDDLQIPVLGVWTVSFVSITNGSLASLAPFAAKNFLQNLFKPGPLVVIRSPVVSVKLDYLVYETLLAANNLIVSEAAAGSGKKTLKRRQRQHKVHTSIIESSNNLKESRRSPPPFAMVHNVAAPETVVN